MWTLGVHEIDVVVDIGRIKDRDYRYIKHQLQSLVQDSATVGPTVSKKCIKVIFETCLLTSEEIVDLSILCVLAGVTVVKTSTGFSTAGADLRDVEMMRLVVGNRLGVKASGGIRDKETMLKMIQNGASLIGTSSGVALCKDPIKNSPPRRGADHCFVHTAKE